MYIPALTPNAPVPSSWINASAQATQGGDSTENKPFGWRQSGSLQRFQRWREQLPKTMQDQLPVQEIPNLVEEEFKAQIEDLMRENPALRLIYRVVQAVPILAPFFYSYSALVLSDLVAKRSAHGYLQRSYADFLQQEFGGSRQMAEEAAGFIVPQVNVMEEAKHLLNPLHYARRLGSGEYIRNWQKAIESVRKPSGLQSDLRERYRQLSPTEAYDISKFYDKVKENSHTKERFKVAIYHLTPRR